MSDICIGVRRYFDSRWVGRYSRVAFPTKDFSISKTRTRDFWLREEQPHPLHRILWWYINTQLQSYITFFYLKPSLASHKPLLSLPPLLINLHSTEKQQNKIYIHVGLTHFSSNGLKIFFFLHSYHLHFRLLPQRYVKYFKLMYYYHFKRYYMIILLMILILIFFLRHFWY